MPIFRPENVAARARKRLERCGAAQGLRRAGTEFLVYDAQLADDDVLLLHFPFSWHAEARQVAVACTSGLCQAPQRQRRKWCFESFEIAIAFYSDGFSEGLLRQLLSLSRDVREWMATSATPAFGIGDWVADFPLLAGRPSALLIPPTPELVQSGLRPSLGGPSELRLADWLNPDALLDAGKLGFLQAVPLFESEYAHVASTRDGFGFFLNHLLATDAELADGKDAAFRILDMARPAAL